MSNPYAPPKPGDPSDGPQEAGPPEAPVGPAATPHGQPQGPGAPSHGAGPARMTPPEQRHAQRPPQPPPDPEAVRAATRPLSTILLLMFATLLVATFPLPWQLGALAFGVAAVVLGIRGLAGLVRAGLGRSPLVVMLTAGLAFTALTLLGIGGTIALWSVQMDRQTCLGNALTFAAEQECTQAYEDALTSRVPGLSSLFGSSGG